MKTSQILTYLIAALASMAAGGGIFINNLYRDKDLIKTAWHANDIVTLLLIPCLLTAHFFHTKEDTRATLLWLGLLLYMFYNYAFYLFGATFNVFFLVYTALFTLSLYALLIGLFHVSGHAEDKTFIRLPSRNAIAFFLALVALPLAFVEGSQCLKFIFYGTEPEIPVLVLTLDLALVVPNTILAVVLLFRKHPWGTILGAMILVKSFTYGLVLLSATILIAQNNAGPWDPLRPFYAFVMLGGLIFLLILMKDIKPRAVQNYNSVC